MARHLLHIDASARTRSYSRTLGRTFADAWREANPEAGYTYRDLASQPVPPIGEAATELSENMARHGLSLETVEEAIRTPEQRRAWEVSAPLLEELRQADVLLIGTPMYNFSVPSTLKAWIDNVTFPGVRLGPSTAVITAARGGSYAPGSPREPFEFLEKYLRAYLTAFGPQDVHVITSELTLAPVMPPLAELREAHEQSHTGALTEARELARRLASEETVAA